MQKRHPRGVRRTDPFQDGDAVTKYPMQNYFVLTFDF